MFAEPAIHIAGHIVTSFELLVVGSLLLCAAAILMGYRKELRAAVKPSAVTDQLASDLNRIANSLEQIARQREFGQHSRPERSAPAERREPEPSVPPAEPASEEAHRIAYSMFGR